MKELSIILLTWNSARFFTSCIHSVLESTKGYDREIILIDNGSTDSTRQMIEPYLSLPDITFIPNSKNEGVAKARNRGISKAKGKYIWLLDIDTVVNKGAITALMEYMRNRQDCGICGCKLRNSEGDVQDSCRKYPSFRYKRDNVLSSLYGKLPFARTLKEKTDRRNQSQFYRQEMASGEAFDVEYIIGACQLIRRQVVEEAGLLDEHIFYGPEDADFCLRANAKGWKVTYLPYVSFIHEYQQMTNKRLISRMSWLHTKALFYFFRKHKQYNSR